MTTEKDQKNSGSTLDSNLPKIVINLNNERDAYAVTKPDHMIHLRERDQIWRLIGESLKFAEKCDGKSRRHDTIMLAGVRGSGKTTFMLSILNFIENEVPETSKYHDWKKIEVLKIVDPTLIEDKTHIFLNIISMIKDKVDEKAYPSNCLRKESGDLSRAYKDWEKSFKKLAEGIPAISGIGIDGFGSESWLDSEFIMEKGVGMARAANKLEQSFHDFVGQSLKFIKKEAFILCFDDIDTNFGKGWPVLEVLHKYLTTPRIITILSGDPSLYSILIRQQQWGNFSEKLLKMEALASLENKKKYRETVAHLEEQYLMKLLKSERRVFLNSLYQKGEQEGEKAIIVEGQESGLGSGKTLRECYQLMMDSFGIHTSGQRESFYRFLASTPLRTQKQLLYAYDNCLVNSCSDFGNSIIDIFWSDLAEKKIDVSNLRNVPHYTTPQIIDYLIRNKILIEGYTLTPLFSDHFTNSAQFALGTLVTNRIKKDPTQIFEYWLRVCLTRELGAIMEGQGTEKGRGPSVEDYVDYCAVNKLRSIRYVARFSTVYIRSYLGYQAGQKSPTAKSSYSKNPWHGTLPLFGLGTTAKDNSPNRIDIAFSHSDHFARAMGYLPLSGATNHKGESLPVYSFYNLLGVLGEILSIARNEEKHAAVNEVSRTIMKNSQYREYPMPTWASELAPGDEDVDKTDDGKGTHNDSDKIDPVLQKFSEMFVQWAARADEPELIVSPSLLGKIFTRFFYATNNMDKVLAQDKNLGNWMHRMVVVFLHSVVLVEAMEALTLTTTNLNLTNPVKKDNIFIENLNNITLSGQKKSLGFSRWILACPIWNVYMKNMNEQVDHSTNYNKFLYSFIDDTKTSSKNNSIYDEDSHKFNINILLSKIGIKTDNTSQQKTTTIKQKPDSAGKLPKTTTSYDIPYEVAAIDENTPYKFGSYDDYCINHLLHICKANNISKNDILNRDPVSLKTIKEILGYTYDMTYFNNYITGIINRLNKDESLWTI